MFARLLESARVSVGVLSLMVGRAGRRLVEFDLLDAFQLGDHGVALHDDGLGVVAENEVLEPVARSGETSAPRPVPETTRNVSVPAPPSTKSRPSPAFQRITSSPPPAKTRSSSAPPVSTSAFAVPTTMSAAAVPLVPSVKRSISPTEICSMFAQRVDAVAFGAEIVEDDDVAVGRAIEAVRPRRALVPAVSSTTAPPSTVSLPWPPRDRVVAERRLPACRCRRGR